MSKIPRSNLAYTMAALAGGALIGGGVTYLLAVPTAPNVPQDANDHIGRIKLQDTVAGTALTMGVVFSIQQEGDYLYYTLGYGLLGKAPNDVIVELTQQVSVNRWYANIAKLGSNPVQVYVDNVLQATLPSLSGVPVNVVQPAYVVVNLP